MELSHQAELHAGLVCGISLEVCQCEGTTALVTAKINNPENIPTSSGKGHSPEGRPAFVAGCYLPTGAVEALKWTETGMRR